MDVDNLIRCGCHLCAIVAYNCGMEKLKPSGISHTVTPANPCKNYNEWMRHITGRNTARKYRWQNAKS